MSDMQMPEDDSPRVARGDRAVTVGTLRDSGSPLEGRIDVAAASPAPGKSDSRSAARKSAPGPRERGKKQPQRLDLNLALAATADLQGAIPPDETLAGSIPASLATPPAGTPVRFRGKGFVTYPHRWVGLVVFVALLLFVEWGARAGYISNLTVPRPTDVIAAFWELWQSGMFLTHLAPSLTRLVVGASLGVGLGIATGLLIGLFSLARAGLVPLVAALFPIPKIALLPLFVIWFGIDEASKYALIAFGTFTPTVVATYGAVDNVDRTLIRMGQSFGLRWHTIVGSIVLPGAMPGILSGLRISLSIAIILLVAAEMLGAQYGIGAYILQAGSLYDLERLFVGVAILSILGVAISALIGTLERKMLSWRV